MTDDDLTTIRGNRGKLRARLKDYYDWDEEMADREIDTYFRTYLDNPLAGKWDQLKGHIQKQWGLLSNDDLDVFQGNYNILKGKLKDYYNLTDDEVETQVSKYLKNF